MRRFLFALSLLMLVSACADATRDLQEPTEPIGDFQIGHIGVVAPNLQKLLVSRDATEDEWITAVTEALSNRFERFDGGKFYHLGVSVEAYSLPPPIVPGKSALALNVTVWDDAAQAKMNEEPQQIHVIKVFESRISKNRDQQLQGLAEEAAKAVETWMREMQVSDEWFVPDPEAMPEVSETVEAPADTGDTPADTTDAADGIVVPDAVMAATAAASGAETPAQ